MRRLLRAPVPFVAVVAALALAPAAQASFPGANGLLAVVPPRGGGVVLTDVHGRSSARLCSSVTLCGVPDPPRFTPDGQSLAFLDQATRRPGVVAEDGTCLWCLLGAPLTRLDGVAVAVTADGQALALAGPVGVWRVPLSGGAARRLVSISATAVAWSAGGAFAFVHAGAIWVALRGRGAHMVALGGAPDFSPDGRRIAFVRGGWIWIIAAAGGRATRVVRGSAPVFSPDGRSLAFIGRSGRVYVAGVRGRHARLVPGVRARALDWQPLPRRAPVRCAVPSGSSVVAQSPEAVVTVNPADTFAPWSGCLRATGRRWSITVVPAKANGYFNTVTGLQLSGRFAAFVLASGDKYNHCSNTVFRVDLGTGVARQLDTQDCSTSHRVIDSLVLDTSGFTAWRASEQVAIPQALSAAACASTSVCVVGDGLGNAASSTAPATGGWTLGHVAPSFSGMTCARATTFCLGWSGGNVMSTTDPATGVWSAPVAIDPNNQIADVACPTSSLCVAVDGGGNVLTDSGGTWTSTSIDSGSFLDGVSCPSATFCVAVGQHGDVLTSISPATGAWSKNPQSAEAGAFAIGGVACPSTTLCVSTDPNGNILTTQDPTHPAAWTQTPIAGASFLSQHEPVCASTSLCLIPDGGTSVLVSTAPTGGSGAWTKVAPVAPTKALVAVACAPQSTLCLATDGQGDVITSTNPAAGTTAWDATPVDVPACGACLAEQLYVQDDRGRQAVDTAQPGPGNVIAGVALAGNSTTLSWTHSGAAEQFGLR